MWDVLQAKYVRTMHFNQNVYANRTAWLCLPPHRRRRRSAGTKDFAPTGNTADAFALKWALFGVGAVVCFIISLPLSIEDGKTASEEQLQIEMVITASMQVLAFVGLVVYTRIQPPGEKKRVGETRGNITATFMGLQARRTSTV